MTMSQMLENSTWSFLFKEKGKNDGCVVKRWLLFFYLTRFMFVTILQGVEEGYAE